MFKEQCKNLFKDRTFYRTMIFLAIPIMIQNLLVSSLNMIDTLMIGSIGENEIAAVGIANQVFFLYNLLIGGVGAGCSMFISQYWGAKDITDIHKTLGVGLLSGLVISLLFTGGALLAPEPILSLFTSDPIVLQLSIDYLHIVCLSYLFTAISVIFAASQRSVGNANLPMVISLLAILTNAFFNWLLIFGVGPFPKLGVEGAAIATLLARLLECALLLIFSLKKNSVLAGGYHDYFHFTSAFFRKIQANSLPVILNEGCWGIGTVFYTIAYGQIGTKAIAATQITNTIQNLFMVLCFSMSSAALVMIGNQIGAKNRENTISYAYKFTILALLLGIILGVIVIFAAPTILTLFNVSEDVRVSAIAILRIFSFMAPVRVMTVILIVGVFRGGGDAGYALKLEAMTMWLIGVPLAFIGAVYLHLSVEMVAFIISAEEITKLALALPHLHKLTWIHDLTVSSAA